MAKKVTGTVNLGGVKITSYSDGSQSRQTTSPTTSKSTSQSASSKTSTTTKTSGGSSGSGSSGSGSSGGSSGSSTKYIVNYGPTDSNGNRTVKYNDGTTGTQNVGSNSSSGGGSNSGSGGTVTTAGSNVGVSSGNLNNTIANTGTSKTQTTGNVYSTASNNSSAQSGLKKGDLVVTAGGTYIIDDVDPTTGKYTSSMYNSSTNKNNYSGYYTSGNTGSSNSNNAVNPINGNYTATSSKAFDARTALQGGQANWTDTSDGSVWTYDADTGNVIATKNGKSYVVDFGDSGTQTKVEVPSMRVTIADGTKYYAQTDENGAITGFLDDNLQSIELTGTITTDNGTVYNGVKVDPVTGTYAIHKVVNNTVKLTDTEGSEKSFTDAEGNVLNSSSLYFCDDNHAYVKSTGEFIGSVAAQYGIDPSNARIVVGDNYWAIDGTLAEAPPLQNIQWTKDDVYNQLFNALVDAGYKDVPQWSNYQNNILTKEQALAQAAQELGGTYTSELNTLLDDMNQKALQTGFYGQLPTEALKQQAGAATKLDERNAIYKLANELMDNSWKQEQQNFENDTSVSNAMQTTIENIIKYLIEINAGYLDEASSQEDLNLRIAEIKEKALEKVSELSAKGYSSKDLLSYANSLKTSN